ncbi:MAG: HAMP domain-containing sensor histidine kinase [Candidatus Izemoplasmatales bacterium]
MISFREFFRTRMARSFTLLFAAMLLLANLTVYLVSGIQYARQTERQEASFVEMMRHLAEWEDEETVVAFLVHYGHTHGVEIRYVDDLGNLVYATEAFPEGVDPIAIVSSEGAPLGTLSIGYRQSLYGAELVWGLAFVNGVSALLFVAALMLLRRYLDRQYAALDEDMARIGNKGAEFRFRDIAAVNLRYTEALAAEEELKTIQAHYVRLLAHDVKTPLTVMKTYLDGIRSGRLSFDGEVNAELLAQIAEIEKTVPQFIEQDLRQVSIRQNVTPVVREHLARLEEVFRTKAMTVVFHGTDLTLDIAAADLVRLLEHLVFNAFYYSEPGGTIEVRIDAATKRMTVSDTGIGMSAETLNAIRTGSHRAQEASKYNQKGSGVGLQIVFEIAYRIGAEVEFESEPGKGTTVIVWFERANLAKGA